MQHLSPAGASVLVGLLFWTPFHDPSPSRGNGRPAVYGELVGRLAQGADDACRSLKEGRIVPSVDPDTIADGLLTSLGDRTFPVVRSKISENLGRW